MKPVTVADLTASADLDGGREEARRRLVEVKEPRRVELGSRLSLGFENRETVVAALEESLRGARNPSPDDVQRAAESFNSLLPPGGALLATLYLEAADPAALALAADESAGVERSVYLELAGERVAGVASGGGEPAAAYALTFELSEAQRRAWRDGAEVAVGVAHGTLVERATLSPQQRWALAADL